MGSSPRNAILSAFLGLVIFPTAACDEPAKMSSTDPLSSIGHAADLCSATRFSDFKNLRQVEHDSTDPITNMAWDAASVAVKERRNIFVNDYCSFEVLASPNQERCFHFYMKKLSVGGDLQLCINSERKVTRVYLNE